MNLANHGFNSYVIRKICFLTNNLTFSVAFICLLFPFANDLMLEDFSTITALAPPFLLSNGAAHLIRQQFLI